jgi:hypothetical protein
MRAASVPRGDMNLRATVLRPLGAAALLVVASACSSGAGGGGSGDRDPSAEAPQGEVTVTGQLGTEPVEGGCASLEADDGTTYQVVGRAMEAIEPLSVVTVQGVVDADAVSTCMVGPILRVTEVTDVSAPPDGDRPHSGHSETQTLSGRLDTDSIEGGCTYLETDDRERYEIAYERGVDPVEPPATVTVRGEVRGDMVSTCMIGPIFVVSEVVSVER